MNKAQLRAKMRAMRQGLSAAEQERAARAVCERLLLLEPYRNARTVMAYMACRGELSLAPVMDDVLAGGKTLLLPRCEAQGIMTARKICSVDDLESGAYGLLEPKESCGIADPGEIDLILVPGVAFDKLGRRLGQGGGYYDRFLSKSGAYRLGICHGFALLEDVPCAAHDIAMDEVITPDGGVSAGRFYNGRT